ncbi:peptidylprolyl isomerase [Candidatus Woesearchaeota archaeon]|nr:peptidylprolyl isomerase [Candidatus Woesearchaeota archaeon]
MAIKKDDFIEIEYTGRLKEDNSVFDTTDENLAKEIEIYNPNAGYGPVIICLGEGQIVKGLDDALIGKEPGKHKIELTAEQAFGKKDAKLIQMVPLMKFTQNEIKPFPGLQVNIDNAMGTVKTVSSGRVLVDFNHPLSGKDIIYELEVKRIVTDKKEQIESLIQLLIGIKDVTVTMEGNKANVAMPANVPPQIAEELKKKIKELTKVDDVSFVDVRKEAAAKKPETKKKEEQKEEKETTTPAQ